ncbi:hypothetical protein Tco_0184902 [Tanacetum coccineum]
MAEFPHIDFGLAVPMFKQGDDPIGAINKMMSFLSTVISSRFPTTNNQLRNHSNPRQKAIIHDGRVTVQLVQGRQNYFVAGTSGTRANISETGGNYSGQQRVVSVLTAKGKVTWQDSAHNQRGKEMLRGSGRFRCSLRDVQDTNSSAQQDAMISSVFEQLSNQVTNCNKVNKDNLIANETLSAELERYKERVKLLEERQNVDLGTREKLIINDIIRDKDAQFADFEKEINSLKQTISEQIKEKESLTKTFNVFKNKSKEKEARNIDKEIALKRKLKN